MAVTREERGRGRGVDQEVDTGFVVHIQRVIEDVRARTWSIKTETFHFGSKEWLNHQPIDEIQRKP